jgi:alpha-tubulin suppressor-like RCC1 family protein
VAAERQAFTIVADIFGNPPFTYQWMRNGAPIAGAGGTTNANTVTLNTQALLAADDGVRFYLEVANANGTARGNDVIFSVIGAPAVVAAETHSLAMSAGGTVYAWGDNSAGQLGLGNNTPRLEPTAVPNLANVVAVAAGRAHSLALRSDGSVVSWGANDQGQLGLGNQTGQNSPQAVAGLTNAVAIAAAGDQSFAVRSDGTLWAWGDNDGGQLGDGTNSDRSQPVQVQGLVNANAFVVAIAASPTHTLAVDRVGRAFAWGDNSFGQHGDTAVASRNAPFQVPGISEVVGVAAGAGFSLAVNLDAQLWSWGRNNSNQLGDGGSANRSTPQRITLQQGGLALPSIIRIEAGSDHALALPSSGPLLAWGSNAQGQLGTGSTGGTRNAPGAVSGTPSELRSIAAGSGHSLVRATAGSVYGWGVNASGQIGNGASGAPVTQPVPANNLSLN